MIEIRTKREVDAQKIPNNSKSDAFILPEPLQPGEVVTAEKFNQLRAAVDWSYSLLSGPERLLLSRLSVFAGGFALEAAEVVCAGDGIEDWEVLDLLCLGRSTDQIAAVTGSLTQPARQPRRNGIRSDGHGPARAFPR